MILLVEKALKIQKDEFSNFLYREIIQHSVSGVSILLVGNMLDYAIEEAEIREVAAEEAKDFAQKKELKGFGESSAKTGQGVDQAMEILIEVLYQQWEKEQASIPKAVGSETAITPQNVSFNLV